ncbi:hypothetical protein EVAR_20506_1 [Eumeta japonica]|uniref:Uncharacterized protein n=1 Tax=Eumeta variegata TaxID=151549 RepID=A0A4C1VKW2_EUMVA|nr:hypothetical protein EVAR_20506_1 [Eumeta japonica]
MAVTKPLDRWTVTGLNERPLKKGREPARRGRATSAGSVCVPGVLNCGYTRRALYFEVERAPTLLDAHSTLLTYKYSLGTPLAAVCFEFAR